MSFNFEKKITDIFLPALRTTENAVKSGGWMILDAAETLFLTAKQRVFGGDDKIERKADGTVSKLPPFEENPKWRAISEVLEEIKNDVPRESRESDDVSSEKVLILTSDERTASQLQDYISLGSKALFSRMFNKSLGEKYGRISGANDDEPAPRKESKNNGVGKKSRKSANNQTLTQMVGNGEEDKAYDAGHAEDPAQESALSPTTLVHPMHSTSAFEFYRLLHTMHPDHVVMYDTDVMVVRQLEVYQANHAHKQLKVTFLMYEKSVEEQSYLTALRKEKEAFESLIRNKAEMVVPEYREGRGDDNPDLARDSAKASDAIMENATTRRAGGQKPDEKQAKVAQAHSSGFWVWLIPKYFNTFDVFCRSSWTCVNFAPSYLPSSTSGASTSSR